MSNVAIVLIGASALALTGLIAVKGLQKKGRFVSFIEISRDS
jgi:hypothetical protein